MGHHGEIYDHAYWGLQTSTYDKARLRANVFNHILHTSKRIPEPFLEPSPTNLQPRAFLHHYIHNVLYHNLYDHSKLPSFFFCTTKFQTLNLYSKRGGTR